MTSVEPLTIYMWDEPYLRFTAENYDASQIENKFMHLTNASILKGVYDKAQVKEEGHYQIRDNMWERHQFD